MLKKVFGNCPQIKVLDFLLSSSNKYFNKSQIAIASEISRPTLDNFIDNFIEFDLLKKTKHGYELNSNSEVVKYFANANAFLARNQLELESKSENSSSINYSDEEIADLLDNVFDEDFDNENLAHEETIENSEEILVNKKEYSELKEFYIKNFNLVKYLMTKENSKEFSYKKPQLKTY